MPHDTLTTLSTLVGTRLKAKGFMLGTAESCTGGWVGQALTAISGSSDYYGCGFITYSNSAKHEILGVPSSLLEQFGAVSEETARAMAAGALVHAKADIALASTGVAGPGGGSGRNPVGTVCFGWAMKGSEPQSARKHFDGDRDAVRRQSVIFSLQGVLERLE